MNEHTNIKKKSTTLFFSRPQKCKVGHQRTVTNALLFTQKTPTHDEDKKKKGKEKKKEDNKKRLCVCFVGKKKKEHS